MRCTSVGRTLGGKGAIESWVKSRKKKQPIINLAKRRFGPNQRKGRKKGDLDTTIRHPGKKKKKR